MRIEWVLRSGVDLHGYPQENVCSLLSNSRSHELLPFLHLLILLMPICFRV